MRVSVIGGGTVGEEDARLAREVGREVGERGHDLVCGGLGGVMEAACRGAREAGARTIGILPGDDPAGANPYVDVPVATGIGHARNVMVVLNGEAVVAVDGAHGTLSEIAHALDLGRPIVGLRTHDVEGVVHVESPTAALDRLEAAVG